MNKRRTNQQWLDELTGRLGIDAQRQAHLDLANYFYVVAYNYLLKRQADVNGIAGYTPDDLASLAQDYVQDMLERIAYNQFALLSKYYGAGSFTSWCAITIRNHIASVLRRSLFTYSYVGLDSQENVSIAEPEQADRVARDQVIEALQDCLNRLADHYRAVLIHCVINRESAQSMADSLKRTVPAVNLLVLRAKRQMRKCLATKGYGPDVLGFF
jgi:RNA polymerase sigma factor (sigma-70 family)